MEIFIQEGKLIEKSKWEELISSMENSFEELETNKKRSKRIIKEEIGKAITERTKNLEGFGIMFSGGVDSTFLALMCKKSNINFTCYSIGLEGSKDIEYSKKIAERYSFNLKCKIVTLEEVEKYVEETIRILKSIDIVWVSVGAVVNAAMQLALKDDCKVLLSGLGTEEIFAGYQRHDEAFEKGEFEELHKECWNGLRNMWQRDLLRDYKLATHFGIEVRTPYMDQNVIDAAMKVHPMHKLDKEEKKIILREIAEESGLEKEFAWRKKKAAQYGSNFVRAMDKIAKKNGFQKKKGYLENLFEKIQ